MKDELEYLNDVKIDLSEYEECSLTDLEKQRIKNKLKKSIIKNKGYKVKKLAMVVAIAIALVGVIKSENITVAIEKVFSKNKVESFTNYQESGAENYKTIVEQSVTNNGVTITVNEVIFDYNNILITYSMKSDIIDTEDIHLNPKVFVNGTEIKEKGFSGTYSNDNKSLKLFELKPREEIPKGKDMDVKIVFGGVDDFFKQDKVIEEGKWEFNFKSNTESIQSVSKKINIDKNITIPKGDVINISEIIATPISTNIEFTVNTIDDSYNPDNLTLKITDSNGNKIDEIAYHWSYDAAEKKVKANIRLKNISEESKVIRITPVIYGEELLDSSFEVSIK